ncbi:MAG: hypothetical protein KDC44_13445, partial [Phaeodactylibacter sp.]|nr:hypothetical protein [Phaeodactylibacter sp.]
MNVKSLLLVGFVLICSYALDAQPKLPKWVRKVNAQIENGDFKAVQTVPTDSSFWNLPYQLRKDLGANYFSAFHLDTLSNGIEVLRLMKEGHGTTLLDRLISGRGYALFYKDDQVLKVLETYTNNSRMGSCGHLEITHEAYFKGN